VKEKITIIVVTHNHRYILVKRLLEYYNNFPVKIIIEDASINKHQFPPKENLDYFHFPKKDMFSRIQHATKFSKTKYVTINQDDDFLLYSSLMKGKKFLDLNGNYSFVSGKNYYFEDFLDFIHLTEVYKDEALGSIDDSNNLNRLLKFCNKSQLLVSSLFNKKHLLKNFDRFNKFQKKIIKKKKNIYFKFTFSLFMLSNYKYKYLNTAWQLRDRNVYPFGSKSNNKNLRHPIIQSNLYESNSEFRKLHKSIKEIYKIKNNLVLDNLLKKFIKRFYDRFIEINKINNSNNYKIKLFFFAPTLFNILKIINKTFRIVFLERLFSSKSKKNIINKIDKNEYTKFLYVLKKYKLAINKLALNKLTIGKK